ncbi:phosphotransferase [Lentzea flava]|uniref:Phosphotransferase n=2 Tax=Lentzea flava TaxID=103732 RepID=A0ABQ2UYX0_9PSEU|nr:putative kinase, aminoglycoside phosphotransferase (APT) family [Lentzea flava]GGU57961.1 phosphotransferase [Lentzea flava]
MHVGEIATDVSLVDELIRTQFPRWHGLQITKVAHGGTDHAIYRLGDELAVRLPRIDRAKHQAGRDAVMLPTLAPHLPVAVPEPLALGEPTENYSFPWSVVRWLTGDTATVDAVRADTPVRLAELIHALQGIEVNGEQRAPHRGHAHQERDDDQVRECIAELGGDRRLVEVWQEALDAPRWDGPGRWLHADLHGGNLLFTDGELTGVVDWGCAGVGDPAGDLMPAWLFLDEKGRRAFRRELSFDDATWARARGWALHLAVIGLPYYRDTNPVFADICRHTLNQLLAER